MVPQQRLATASSRLVRESLAALGSDRLGVQRRREASEVSSHARKRVVGHSDGNRGQKGRYTGIG